MSKRVTGIPSTGVITAGLLFATLAFAQVGTIDLVGTVRDPSGAVVAGVKITLTNADTGYARVSLTNGEGVFTLTALTAGSYILDAEAAGFKRKRIDGIVLTVDQRTRLDVGMEVGGTSEVVEVTETAPLVESENPTIGRLIDSTTILQLPLNGRDFMQLALLVGGVNESQAGSPESTTPVAAGIPYVGNAYTLDGASNKADLQNTVASAPILDSIKEFKVQVGQNSAEYGFGGGAAINAITQSGGNAVRGSLWEFHRNKSLDAFPFFRATNNAGQPTKAPLIRNQYGATFGGPLAKNRTFYFGGYEALRERRAPTTTTRTRMPTAAERGGDLSSYAAYFKKTIRDPGNNNTPFPGNVIPSSRLDPIAKKMVDAVFVDPNQPGDNPLGNFYSLLKSRSDNHSYILRVDHRLSRKFELSGRYNLSNVDTLSPGAVALGLRVGDRIATDRRRRPDQRFFPVPHQHPDPGISPLSQLLAVWAGRAELRRRRRDGFHGPDHQGRPRRGLPLH